MFIKMSRIEIKNVDDVVDFSQVNEKEKEKFVEKIMLRQIEFMEKIMLRQIKQLAKEHHEYFDLGVVALIDSIKKINVAKIVRNLSGVR